MRPGWKGGAAGVECGLGHWLRVGRAQAARSASCALRAAPLAQPCPALLGMHAQASLHPACWCLIICPPTPPHPTPIPTTPAPGPPPHPAPAPARSCITDWQSFEPNEERFIGQTPNPTWNYAARLASECPPPAAAPLSCAPPPSPVPRQDPPLPCLRCSACPDLRPQPEAATIKRPPPRRRPICRPGCQGPGRLPGHQ